MISDNPILNNPYNEPLLHYATDLEGSLNYQDIRKGRRIFTPDFQVMPNKQGPQSSIFEVNDMEFEYGTHLINLCRQEVGHWRKANYPNTTRITKELLNFWFNNPERIITKKLFFAQQEAVETAILINEVAEKSHLNHVVMDSDWEGIYAKTLEEISTVESYVKNQFLGFAIPYTKDGKDRQYFTDFIARVKSKGGTIKNLMIEISGMSKDKAEKK